MKKMIFVIAGVIALLVASVQIYENQDIYGKITLICLAITVFCFWAAFKKANKKESKSSTDDDKILTQTRPARRRPVLEVLQALSKRRTENPLTYLLCSQVITNDGLNPIRQLSSEEKQRLYAQKKEMSCMKEVESILRNVYNNNNYILMECEYYDAIVQLIPSFAQQAKQTQPPVESNASAELIQYEENGKYGFKDKATGRIVIQAKYDYAGSFTEGLAQVKLNKKYGFIDKTGKEVIPCKYDLVEGFRNGKAKVELNREEFLIDKSGNRIN